MSGEGLESVGVVVIGRNEGERLERCLRSVPAAIDRIAYVDSGSTDDSVGFARSLGVLVVELDLSIPFTAARARNAGIAALIERWPDTASVQVVDGDCEIVDGWIEQAARHFSDHPKCAVVCGRRRERFSESSIYNRIIDLEWDTPVGPARSCGGDALLRRAALEEAGWYRESMIAGEEPELCYRLRRLGWSVVRLDAEMTVHDAAMSRFGQFLKRAKRAGHAYAESAALHGRGSERFGVKQVRSAVLWGGLLPIAAVAAAWWTAGLSVLAFAAILLVQYRRIRRRGMQRGRPARHASLVAAATLASKPAQLSGVVLYWFRRLTGRRSRLIEYKAPSKRERSGVAGG
jgi:GT2 family glycosyltransferase